MNKQRSGVFALIVLAFIAPACALVSGGDAAPAPAPPASVDGAVTVSFDSAIAEISPLIRGVSGRIEDFEGAGVTLNSWGGQRATRYNYQLGNAWNQGRNGAFRNEGVASTDDLVGDWLASNEAAGVVSRVAVPGLGWIARDGSSETCSFPDDGGGCLTADAFDCARSGPIADPARANVGSSPQSVAEWIDGYVSDGAGPEYLAVDNEPERWGIDHYDVHPTCSDYFEILGTYLAYATALRDVAPRAQLTGPVMCCWYDYANPPGPDDESDQDLLSWFLERISERPATEDGRPLLDVADVHFRPSADVVTSRSDAEIDELRIEATRELWDPEHRADQGPVEPIEFLPRLRRTIDEVYPGMPLMVSDWRFGGESSTSGALVVALALGVFAREGVEAAAHADTIAPGSPAFFGFKLFGDYDDLGGAFEGLALETVVDDDLESVQAFAALDGRTLRLLLVNSSTDPEAQRIDLDLGAVEPAGSPKVFTYSGATPDEIVESRLGGGAESSVVELAAMTATMVELKLRDAPEPTLPASSVPADDTSAG